MDIPSILTNCPLFINIYFYFDTKEGFFADYFKNSQIFNPISCIEAITEKNIQVSEYFLVKVLDAVKQNFFLNSGRKPDPYQRKTLTPSDRREKSLTISRFLLMFTFFYDILSNEV